MGSTEEEPAIYASKLLGKKEQVIAAASTSYSTQAGQVAESEATFFSSEAQECS